MQLKKEFKRMRIRMQAVFAIFSNLSVVCFGNRTFDRCQEFIQTQTAETLDLFVTFNGYFA